MPAHKDTFGRFYMHPSLQADGSYKDVAYVEIFIKGNKNTSFSRPMKNEDKENWPKAWKAFQDEGFVVSTGTSLRSLPGIGPSQVLNLNAVNIHSIEDLADLGESALHDIQGARELQKRAKAYLAAMEVDLSVPDDEGDPLEGMDESTVVAKEPEQTQKRRGRPSKAA